MRLLLRRGRPCLNSCAASPYFIYCTWPAANTAWRISMSIIALCVYILLTFSLLKRKWLKFLFVVSKRVSGRK